MARLAGLLALRARPFGVALRAIAAAARRRRTPFLCRGFDPLIVNTQSIHRDFLLK